MKIGIVTIENLENKKAWSGIIYHTYQELCNRYGKDNIIHVSTYEDRLEKNYWFIYRLIARLCGKRATKMDRFISRRRAVSVRRDLITQVDVLFAPAASVDISFLEVDKPIIYMSDATFKLLDGYYTPTGSYFSSKVREAFMVEKSSLQRSSMALFASHWAVKSAIDDFHLPIDKIAFVPFGANLEDYDVDSAIRRINNQCAIVEQGRLNLLFVGVSWERKGGREALDCVYVLNKMGFDATLHIVGIKNIPEECQACTYVKNHGFLNKNDQSQYNELIELYVRCDLFLLPTKAECAGIVFAEASAFGLPIFTYDTGGIGDYVINGVNGYRLPISSTGKDFASQIEWVIQKGELGRLGEGGRKLYSDTLNWKHWGECFDKVIHQLNVTDKKIRVK